MIEAKEPAEDRHIPGQPEGRGSINVRVELDPVRRGGAAVRAVGVVRVG